MGWEGHIRTYQTSDGALKHEGKGTENGTPVTALSVYPDDERFAVVSNSGDLKVFSALSGEELWAKEDAHGTWIQAVCTNTPGSILFSGDDDGLIKAWNANDGKLMFEATVHQGLAICVLLCLPDGRLLVGCADGKLFLCSSEDCAVQSKKLVSDSDVRPAQPFQDLLCLEVLVLSYFGGCACMGPQVDPGRLLHAQLIAYR